jgi:hypothetical protein
MRIVKRSTHLAVLPALVAALATATLAALPTSGETVAAPAELFVTSDQCQACHNNLEVRAGEDLSIGVAWRATMMAHSGVDPYWKAGVRRETVDHPLAKAAIEDKCATCHMPMARFARRESGLKGNVLADSEGADLAAGPTSPEARDGVSCSVCHQIRPDNLGREESFTGGFEVDATTARGERAIFGPFEVATATRRVMRSASGFEPREGEHVQGSELCATCHTLYTHPLDDAGNEIGEFPEQVPYLEWLHSDYAEGRADPRTCQDCHMQTAEDETPVSSVLGPPREEMSKHSFRGGNFFMLRVVGDNRHDVGARALPQELDLSVRNTADHLESEAAEIAIARDGTELTGDALIAEVAVENLAGHKLPTAYPSRRVWIHLTVRDAAGEVVFESGALQPDGSIAGNDNDRDATRFEPHHEAIGAADQVQIYEAVMQTVDGAVTTGLMEAYSYAKDNRVVPLGFDKASADPDVAVHGAALEDETFTEGRDRVRYEVAVDPAAGPYEVTAELWYQPVGYRWARNLEDYDAPEPRAFVEMYDAFPKQDTALLLASDAMTVEPPPPPPAPMDEDPEAE